ncbi:hypothetical protein, partial [Campylobacter fetus]|uniref:hypothetical protein n=1 Tax=Campylobacter fetus TaxID=196 RepID=UPI001F21CCC1
LCGLVRNVVIVAIDVVADVGAIGVVVVVVAVVVNISFFFFSLRQDLPEAWQLLLAGGTTTYKPHHC